MDAINQSDSRHPKSPGPSLAALILARPAATFSVAGDASVGHIAASRSGSRGAHRSSGGISRNRPAIADAGAAG